MNFENIVGMKFKAVTHENDEIVFTEESGRVFKMWYEPDCCASCSIEEIHGELEDLVNTPILMAEEVSSSKPTEEILAKRKSEYEKEVQEYQDQGREPYYTSLEDFLSSMYGSETWTFYKASTIKGSVTIRWYGSSNGYYSESASFAEFINGDRVW